MKKQIPLPIKKSSPHDSYMRRFGLMSATKKLQITFKITDFINNLSRGFAKESKNGISKRSFNFN